MVYAAAHNGKALPRLFEDEVGDGGFEIPIDDGVGGQIEGGVGKHEQPDAAGDSEDSAENETDDSGFLPLRDLVWANDEKDAAIDKPFTEIAAECLIKRCRLGADLGIGMTRPASPRWPLRAGTR